MTTTLGIDLGTTYSCIASYQRDEFVIIPSDYGKNTTPSYVAFSNLDGSNDTIVGEAAKDLAWQNPENTIYDMKPMTGRRLHDPFIRNYSQIWPFKLTEDDKGELKILVHERPYSPPEISSEILKVLKKHAEEFLGKEEITKAVITVPAYFNQEQKELTAEACARAGLEVLECITEPVAAAIAYNAQQNCAGGAIQKNIFVFDLGGGTFDVAILTFNGAGELRIRNIGGDPHLGGEDIDNNMVQYCLDEFRREHGIDLVEHLTAEDRSKSESCSRTLRIMRRLRMECEKQKCFLSSPGCKKISIEVGAVHNGIDLIVPISRQKFEELNEKLFQKCLMIVESTLLASGLVKDQIDEILVVGGSSRILRVQQLLSEYFGKPLTKRINADEAVAYGAALQAHSFQTSLGQNSAADVIIQGLPLDGSSPGHPVGECQPLSPHPLLNKTEAPTPKDPSPEKDAPRSSFTPEGSLNRKSQTQRVAFTNDDFLLSTYVYKKKSNKSRKKEPESTIFELNLGDTYCCLQGGSSSIYVPSYVGSEDGILCCGSGARDLSETHPQQSAFQMLHMLDRSGNSSKLKKLKPFWPFQVRDVDGRLYVNFEGQLYSPVMLLSSLINHLRWEFNSSSGFDVTRVVVTVPYFLTELQRDLVQVAINEAGMSMVKCISQPVAAALYLRRTNATQFDLLVHVGSSFAALVLARSGNTVHVLASGGDENLGGEGFTRAMVEHCLKVFKKQNNRSLRLVDDEEGSSKLSKLQRHCNEQKVLMFSRLGPSHYGYGKLAKDVCLEIPSLEDDLDLKVSFNSDLLLRLIRKDLQKMLRIIQLLLAQTNTHTVNNIYLSGGSCNVYYISELLMQKLYSAFIKFEPDVSAATIGGTLLAAFLESKK